MTHTDDSDVWDDPATCLHPYSSRTDTHCLDCNADTAAIDAEQAKVRDAFARAGFAVEHTGGNCRAYVRRDGEATTVVTREGDAILPALWCEACSVGVYTTAGWRDGADPVSEDDTMTTREILARFL